MSSTVTVSGQTYSVPAEGDSGWANDVSNLLIQLATSTKVLQSSAGSFPITSELNLGNSFGLKSLYLKSQAANPSSAGAIRLGNADTIGFRNSANNADLLLSLISDKLNFNSIELVDLSSAQTLTNKTFTNPVINSPTGISKSDIGLSNVDNTSDATKNSAAVSLINKVIDAALNSISNITNSSISNSAAIVYSKLALSNSIVNADIGASAAIAYSKLALTNSIANADISSSAAITLTKLAATTASRALVSDASGFITPSATTSTEIGYVSGVTSSIQTQINSKFTLPALTAGSVVFSNGATLAQNNSNFFWDNTNNRLGIGTSTPSQILSLGGTTARTIIMERNTTAATAGQGLTLNAGGAIAGTADLAGGDLLLKSGISTGTGTSAVRIFTATAAGTGTADNTPTEKMTILGNGNVGIGVTSPSFPLEVTKTDTSTSGTINNISSTLTINAAAASSTSYRASFGGTINASAQSFSSSIVGGHFENRWTGGGSSTNSIMGVNSLGMILGGATVNFGTLTEVTGLYTIGVSSFSNTATGTISNTRGVRVLASSTTTQTLTNQVGVSIDPMSAATNNTLLLMGVTAVPAGNYGIYNASTNNNYFAGNVGIGTTSPSNKLHVVNTSAQLRLSYDATKHTTFSTDVSGNMHINPTTGWTYWDAASVNNYFFIYNNAVGSNPYAFMNGQSLALSTIAGVSGVSINGAAASYFNGGAVGIGTASPNTSALLDITSTTEGFLQPRMTTTQRNAITTPATGLSVYDTTLNLPYYYNGSAWISPTAGVGTAIISRAVDSAGQAIPTGAVTIVNFNSVTYDTPAGITTGASWKFTNNTGATEYFDVSAQLNFVSNTGGGSLIIYIYKNGSQYSTNYTLTGAAAPYAVNISDSVQLANTDYIDIRVLQNAGVARSLTAGASFVTIKKIK